VASLKRWPIIENLSNMAIKATGLFIIEGFQQTNSYGPCMYNNYGTAQVQGNIQTHQKHVRDASETRSRCVRDAFETRAGRVRD